jgi:hypothetical protein
MSKHLFKNFVSSSPLVVFLHPGETVYVVTRYGPHEGQFMFHCHNLPVRVYPKWGDNPNNIARR